MAFFPLSPLLLQIKETPLCLCVFHEVCHLLFKNRLQQVKHVSSARINCSGAVLTLQLLSTAFVQLRLGMGPCIELPPLCGHSFSLHSVYML